MDSTTELLPETESPPTSSLTPAPAPDNAQEIPSASVTKQPPSKPVTPYPHALLEAAIAGVLELLLKQRGQTSAGGSLSSVTHDSLIAHLEALQRLPQVNLKEKTEENDVSPAPQQVLPVEGNASVAGAALESDAATPSAAYLPEPTTEVVATPSPVLTADTTPAVAQQGILGLEPGSDAATPSPANVPESTPGAVAAPSPVLTGDTTPGLPQQGTLGLEPGSDTS
ncbi:angiomotin-like [Schistocerca nitens]|uniref:angiomotin-like n=1 Tax=Schistocerca nitens TaxID=7011 RepID=UPI0021184B3F|nr:angiomotin-like [Schistocerca nitens]